MKLEQQLEFAQQLMEYLKTGGAIKTVEAHAPRKSERTFPPTCGSVFNMGAKTNRLKMQGYRGTRR